MINTQLGTGFDGRKTKRPTLQCNQHSKVRWIAAVKLLIAAIHILLFLSNELRGAEAFRSGYLLSQWTSRILWNPELIHSVHSYMCRPLAPFLSPLNSIHSVPCCSLKTNFNIISLTRRSSRWSLSFRFSHQTPLCTLHLPLPCNSPSVLLHVHICQNILLYPKIREVTIEFTGLVWGMKLFLYFWSLNQPTNPTGSHLPKQQGGKWTRPTF